MDSQKLDRLYRSFEGPLLVAEQKQLNDDLAASRGLQAEKRHIEDLRVHLAARRAIAFRPFFATRVMGQIASLDKELNFSEGILVAFRRIAAVGLIILIAIVSYNMIINNSYSLTSALALHDTITLENSLEADYILAWEDWQ